MKVWLIAGFGLVAGSAAGQEFVAPSGPRELPVVPGPQVAPPTKIEGIVAKIFNVEKPWLLVSPLAPASYGNGQGTVATSEQDPGKPKGFIFLALSSGSAPVIAFFCATYLKPEMHHIHRQIFAGDGWRPVVLAQKVENRATFPVETLDVAPRSRLRFLARAAERHLTGAPWQISRGEAARMGAVLRARGAQGLHVFFGNVAVHLLPLLEGVDLPVVVSFHGADVTGAIATPGYRAAREAVFARAARVACRSEALAGEVARLGCPREKLVVIRTALPEREFQPRALPADGAVRLVQACRLVPKKGVATSLAAFAALAARHPRMTLVVAGTGPLEGELRDRAEALGLAERVEFTGFLGQAELRDLLTAAHVFLHPSETVKGDVEGVPNGLLEAMAVGLPVVATRHGGIPEAVEDGVGGLLCVERDAAGVAAAVARLIGDAGLYARIAAGGAAAVRAKFSRAVVGAELGALYRAVAGL